MLFYNYYFCLVIKSKLKRVLGYNIFLVKFASNL